MNATTHRNADTTPESCFAASTRAGVPDPDRPDFAGWSRRSFLGVLAALAGGTVAGCAMGGGNDRQSVVALTRPRGRKDRSGDGPAPTYPPTPPFALTSQSVLSEDYFLVQNHNIDPANEGEKVIAYSRADGQVEAMVLQDGAIKQVYRDPTQPGGWNAYQLPGTGDVVDMVAGMSSPGYGKREAAVLKVFYIERNNLDKLHVAVEKTKPAPGIPATFDDPHDGLSWLNTLYVNPLFPDDHTQGKLQVAVNYDTGLLVTAIKASVGSSGNDAKLAFWTDSLTADHPRPIDGTPIPVSYGVLDGFRYDPRWTAGFCAAAMVAADWATLGSPPFIYLYVPDAQSKLEVWCWELRSNTVSGTMSNAAGLMLNPTTLPESNTYVVGVASLSVVGAALMPTALIWTKQLASSTGTRLWACTFDTGHKAWRWTELKVPDSVRARTDVPRVATALTPRVQPNTSPNGAHSLLDVYVLDGDTLNVFREVEQTDPDTEGTTPIYTPIIPLHPGVAAATSQPCLSTGNELMVVARDGSLQTLEQDPISGTWTDHAVQLPASELQQASSYRVTMTLADTAWNASVPGHDLTITAATPTMAVVEGPTPRTVSLGAEPVTVSTDFSGQLTVALLADGLSAATLTITGQGLPTAVTIYPSAPVNDYLQGKPGTRLNLLPTMSADTLAAAKTPDGQTVAPGAADPSAAASAFTDMQQAAGWGADAVKSAPPSVGRTRGGHRRQNPTRPDIGLSVLAQTTSLTHWVHDAEHAIKKGAVAVKTVVKDVEGKAVDIYTDAAGWLDNAVHVVVDSLENAAHVLHSVFNKIGAEIVKVVKWVQAAVGSLLQDSAKVAREFSDLLGGCLTFVGSQTATGKKSADTWIDNERDNIKKLFDRVRAGYGTGVTLDNVDANKPPKVLPGSPSRAANRPRPPAKPGLRAESDTEPQPHGDWFFNKVKHAIGGTLNTPEFTGTNTTYDNVATDLRTAGQAAVADLEKAVEQFWLFLTGAITHPSEIGTMGVAHLLGAISDLVDAAFVFLKGILDALFDLITGLTTTIQGTHDRPGMLGTPLKDMGIVGKLLALAGLGDYSIGSVVMMIFAFPATLTYKIINGGDTRPFDYASTLQGRAGEAVSPARGLQITASALMGTWAGFDSLAALMGARKNEVPMLFPAIDIVAPILVGALAPPTKQKNVENGLPVWHASDGSWSESLAYLSWGADVAPGFFAAHSLYIDHAKPTDPTERDYAKKIEEAESDQDANLYRQTMMGVVSLVAGVLAANADDTSTGSDYAVAILNNLPNIVGFCGLKDLVKSTDGGSLVIGAGVTFYGGVAGAAVYGA